MLFRAIGLLICLVASQSGLKRTVILMEIHSSSHEQNCIQVLQQRKETAVSLLFQGSDIYTDFNDA